MLKCKKECFKLRKLLTKNRKIFNHDHDPVVDDRYEDAEEAGRDQDHLGLNLRFSAGILGHTV